ncbi:uncharacterized protein LOC141837939 [Curcuma longa]|uniref:uncharacterized protein LOC141837939 n=1 Tax=Curcuma longa TaxID=136217 RepID=UPI003D9EB0FF
MFHEPPCCCMEDSGSSLVRKSDIAYIEEMYTALQSFGIPASVYQPETYLRHGYTEALLAKLLRPLQNYNDSVKLENVLHIGIDHRHFNSRRGASADQFYHFLEFLRTPAGQNALSLVSQEDRLARKSRKHFTEQEMAWIAMFEVQCNDLTKRLDDIRRNHKDAINDLDLQLCEALHQLETGLTQIKGKFLPAEFYTPLPDADFNKACWTEYTLACRRQEQLPVMISRLPSMMLC